jgi:selenocysteine lyase/cysteine desulfurase
MQLLIELGAENVAAAVLDITDYLCERIAELGLGVVSPRQGEQRSGIVSLEFPDADLLDVRRHCLAQGVALACRAGRIRVSPHGYNTREDVDRLVAALKSYSI